MDGSVWEVHACVHHSEWYGVFHRPYEIMRGINTSYIPQSLRFGWHFCAFWCRVSIFCIGVTLTMHAQFSVKNKLMLPLGHQKVKFT